ncbi:MULTISPECIES: type IV secretory system conjugative DNA transfer family protein [Frankiaceae]|uniref:type IV secretory system conjugative DNA transfer family protein n=1 Tax=Frankiaceae TaxID=74712 RepID=UPI001D0024D5|nr:MULTISPECIES: type IV secretory system conjugative DNA transfer family protein [Frankiaceae]
MTMPGAVEDMLAEARGYRLSMTLAHQHLRQLPDDLADALSTNARSKLFFGVSPKDAADLARHVSPVLTQHDLARLPAWTAAARLVVNQEDTAAFTLRTRPLTPPVPGRADALREAARRHAVVPDAGRGPRGGRP